MCTGAAGKPGADGKAGPAGKDGKAGADGKAGPAGKDGALLWSHALRFASAVAFEPLCLSVGAAGKAGADGKAGPAGKDGTDATVLLWSLAHWLCFCSGFERFACVQVLLARLALMARLDPRARTASRAPMERLV